MCSFDGAQSLSESGITAAIFSAQSQDNTTRLHARRRRLAPWPCPTDGTVDVPPRPKETEGRMRTARQRREVWERRYSRVDDVIVRGGEGRGSDGNRMKTTLQASKFATCRLRPPPLTIASASSPSESLTPVIIGRMAHALLTHRGSSRAVPPIRYLLSQKFEEGLEVEVEIKNYEIGELKLNPTAISC